MDRPGVRGRSAGLPPTSSADCGASTDGVYATVRSAGHMTDLQFAIGHTSSVVARRRACVVFPSGNGVQQWQDRDRHSPVPGHWPYGLDQLANSGWDVFPVEVDAPPRWQRWAPWLPLSRPVRSGADVAFARDERAGALLAERVRAPHRYSGIVWATDDPESPEEKKERARLGRLLPTLDGLWVHGDAQVSLVQEWLGARIPVQYVRFGIDADFYRPRPGMVAGPLVVSFGGDRARDTETLYSVLAEVRRSRPDVRAIVQTTSRLSPPDGVELRSFIPHDEIRQLLPSAAVIIVPTRPNTHISGVTVSLEAGACGRPAVATDTPGMRDYVVPGLTGELASPGDVSGFSAKVLDLLADGERADGLGAAARKRIEQDFTTATMCFGLAEMAGMTTEQGPSGPV